MITPAKVRRRSALFSQSARMLHLHLPADATTKIVNAQAFSGIAEGANATLATNGMGGCVSAYVSLGTVTGTFNITIRVTGYDNTDTLVTSDVTLSQADTAGQTSVAFSHITEVKYLIKNSGTLPGTVTLSVGPKVSDTTDFATVGLPFQGVPAAAIRSIANVASGGSPTYTYNVEPGTITSTAGTALVSAATYVVTLADEYANWM